MLSTVANTAFSSATEREATVKTSARAAPDAAIAKRLNIINLRIGSLMAIAAGVCSSR
jgi:hypothetical protein